MAGDSKQQAEWLRSKMVGWYDPRQLAVTGLQTVLSALFGQRADYRLIEALQEKPPPHPYQDKDVIWIDYVSDVGDGFNSTYSVARLLARESLLDGDGSPLERGQVLVMGGDEVYPTPSHAAYQDRLVRLYSTALDADDTSDKLDLYAIPGNHDWYDGLGSFMNLFCHGNRIGAWQTPQRRSYFALRFAHGYWLLGVDIQLQSDVDNPQIDYFLGLDIQPGDRLILCTAEPDWIYGNIHERPGKNLSVLENRLVEEKKAVIVLQLAGDLHHYRRHTLVREDGSLGDKHLVTAGGGGAFLHPTHTHHVDKIRVGADGACDEYALNQETEYPSRALSRRLGAKNLAFAVINPWFCPVTGGLYTVLAWVMPVGRLQPGPLLKTIPDLLWTGLVSVSAAPSGLVWVAFTLFAVVAFTDTDRRLYKWIAGLLHGSAHLAASLCIASATAYILEQEHVTNVVFHRFLSSLFTFVGGALVGATIMGVYLTISVCFFGRHGNDAFSALRIEGYKNFVRMRLDAKGLSVWAFGLDAVPKDWELKEVGEKRNRYELKQNAPLAPRVIDHFVIPARAAIEAAPLHESKPKGEKEAVTAVVSA